MNKGFSLIEVLVVALIIVTLALVARPLYENAVWKSRAQSLQIAVKNVAEAQERYRLANGECAQTFEELDMSVDSLPQTTLGLSTTFFMLYGIRPLSEDAVRGNDFFEVAWADLRQVQTMFAGLWADSKKALGREGNW